jgi:hypothetical protein
VGFRIIMSIKKAMLRSFNSGDYTATIEIAGSLKAYLEEVSVAYNLPASEMIIGRKLAVIFFDEHNAKDAVIIAVY